MCDHGTIYCIYSLGVTKSYPSGPQHGTSTRPKKAKRCDPPRPVPFHQRHPQPQPRITTGKEQVYCHVHSRPRRERVPHDTRIAVVGAYILPVQLLVARAGRAGRVLVESAVLWRQPSRVESIAAASEPEHPAPLPVHAGAPTPRTLPPARYRTGQDGTDKRQDPSRLTRRTHPGDRHPRAVGRRPSAPRTADSRSGPGRCKRRSWGWWSRRRGCRRGS